MCIACCGWTEFCHQCTKPQSPQICILNVGWDGGLNPEVYRLGNSDVDSAIVCSGENLLRDIGGTLAYMVRWQGKSWLGGLWSLYVVPPQHIQTCSFLWEYWLRGNQISGATRSVWCTNRDVGKGCHTEPWWDPPPPPKPTLAPGVGAKGRVMRLFKLIHHIRSYWCTLVCWWYQCILYRK